MAENHEIRRGTLIVALTAGDYDYNDEFFTLEVTLMDGDECVENDADHSGVPITASAAEVSSILSTVMGYVESRFAANGGSVRRLASEAGRIIRAVLEGASAKEPCPDVGYVPYVTGRTPGAAGVYACRVPKDGFPGFYEDIFLMWIYGGWVRLGSDQKYRGDVTGWIGPLQRKI